jgi:hypothetical protein
VSGIWGSIRRQLLWTYVPLLLVYMIVMLLFAGATLTARHWLIAGFFFAFSILDFIAMGYVAMWNGMRLRNVQQAAGRALLRVLILPWALWSMLVPVVQEFELLRALFEEFGSFGFFIVGLFIWLSSTVIAIVSAGRKLFTHFREAATDRYNFEQRTSLFALARRWSDMFLTVILLRSRRPSVLG